MRVLVTGSEGYIGPIMIGLLKSRGHTVVGTDVGYFRECVDPLQKLPEPDEMIIQDIRQFRERDLEGVDAIIHLSALSNDPMGQLNPELTHFINFEATERLANMAKNAGVGRFVMASSCSIYGASSDPDQALDETAEFNPVSAYAVSKVKGEEMLGNLADDNFSPVYMRNATAYGVSPRVRFDLVLSNLMAWAMTTGSVKVMSDGTPWRPLTHIEDIALGAVSAAEAPREAVHNEAFNIGRNDANYQIRDIAEAVQSAASMALGKQVDLEITGEAGGDSRSYKVDFSKALNSLPGFKPNWTLEKGCDELVTWFKKHPDLPPEILQDRKYVRLNQLKHLLSSGRVNENLNVIGEPL